MKQAKSPKTVRYSWADIDRMTRQIAARVLADGFVPDVIVGILRGGCIPAVHLSHLLKVRPFHAILLQTTLSDEIRAPRVEPRLLAALPFDAVNGRRVLLVDDVTNTGATMRTAVEVIQRHNPKELRTAALVWDRLALDGSTVIRNSASDYWIEQVDAWVTFPWGE